MKRSVYFRAAARTDLQQAYDWYEERRVGLGDEFLGAVSQAILRMETNAESFPPYYRGFHRVLTHRFPYKLFFRIEGDIVIVFRVLHGAQDHKRNV